MAIAGRADGRALRSTDGGVSWTTVMVSSSATRIELAYARSDPQIVYATVSDTGWRIHVWRSTDGGQNYVQRSNSSIATYSLYNNCLWVDPTDSNNLVAGWNRAPNPTVNNCFRNFKNHGLGRRWSVNIDDILAAVVLET